MKKVRLGDIVTVITKGTTPTTLGYNFVDDGVNFVKIESITENGDFLTDKFAHISDECDRKLSRSQLQRNDLLFSIAGAIGRTAIVTDDILPANTNQALAIIRVPEGIVDYSYLNYVLQSPGVVEQFEKKKQGVAQLNISLKDIGDFVIPLRTAEEQKTVVSTLNKVSELIALRKEQLAKLDQLVKSRFIELFGDVKTNKLGWEKCKFGDVSIKITDGEHGTVPRVNKGEGYLYLMARNITKDGTVDLSETSYVPEDVHRKIYKRCNPEKGDILLVCVGATIGKCTIVPADLGEFSMARSVALIKPDKQKADNAFLISLLKSDAIQSDISECAHAAAQAGLYTNMIVNLDAFLPTLELQKQFAAFVEQTDKSKLAIQQSLEKLELLKKSLMQEYFG